MIKTIRDLNNLDPELKEKVLQRFEALPYKRELIRYSYGELQKLAHHQSEFFTRWGENGIFAFRQGYTDAELAVIDSIGRSNRNDFIDRQKQKVKVSSDRVSRIIRDLILVCTKEFELRDQIQALETARTRIGQPKS